MLQVLFIFFFCLSIKLGFALLYYLRLALYKVPTKNNVKNTENQSVSVIVCYHNESKNAISSLHNLSRIKAKNLEIVLVDDMSTDDTFSQLSANLSSIMRVVQNTTEHKGKKMALSHGINNAKYDWLLMTDADCRVGEKWVKSMRSMSLDHQIVLGYAPLDRSKSWIGKFARYETYYTALQYLSFALAGRPYMGVGRNLMYHRNIFDDADGFTSHTDIASGDDDLLINYAANAVNTTICLDPESFVYSPGKETFSSFIRQKTRHVSSSHRYRWVDKLLLGLSSISQMGLYILAVVLLFSQYSSWVLLLPAYWLLMMMIQYPICKKLHSIDLWLLYPVYDMAMAMYYIIMIPFTFIKKQNTWS